MADKDSVFDRYAFANEGMARNLAVVPHLCVLLNLHERADLRVVANLATVQVDEL